MEIIICIVLLIIGFFLLVKGADLFVDGCSNIARSLGVSSLIIGLTIVAFGTSAPELAVSLIASINNQNNIAMGNVIGSNICNLLLVLGTSALFGKITTKRTVIARDMVYSVFSYVVLIILSFDQFMNGPTAILTQTNGLILLCFLGVYVYALIYDAKTNGHEEEKNKKEKFKFKYLLLSLFGLTGIILGGEFVVNNATKLASIVGLSDHVIALTVVAIGTSLPELVTSVVAVKKGETDIAIGNVIGSCIFNIFMILGLSSAISPITYNINSFVDMIIMLLSGIMVLLFVLRNNRIGKTKGPIMIMCYIAYIVYIVLR